MLAERSLALLSSEMLHLERESENHGHTLDGARGVLWNVEGRTEALREDRDSTGRPTLSTNPKLSETKPPTKHKLDLGPLHICSKFTAWFHVYFPE